MGGGRGGGSNSFYSQDPEVKHYRKPKPRIKLGSFTAGMSRPSEILTNRLGANKSRIAKTIKISSGKDVNSYSIIK